MGKLILLFLILLLLKKKEILEMTPSLANFVSSLVAGGAVVIVIGIALSIISKSDKIKPEIARDEDIFFSTMGFLYSCILMVHGWRLDPILLFSQVLIIITVLVAGWENIRLRGLIANLAKSKKKNKNRS